jgi:N utilization substance protein A
MPKIIRTEFAAAINQICSERGIKPEVVLESIKQAILAAFRKDASLPEEELEGYSVNLNPDTGEARVLNPQNEDVTPPGFGRIAAQTAKQIILQRVREAEKDAIITEYRGKLHTVINGMMLRFEGKTAIIDIGRGQALMPPEEQSAEEFYRLNQRLAVYITEIRDTTRGERIIVSRRAPELVKELFVREVPEVKNESVEIARLAREAGRRTKIAVKSQEEGVDPVGACVGQKGVRVQAVINQLGGEKIDIIEYTDNPVEFIRAALSPATGLVIKVDEKTKVATIEAPQDQQSIAIGAGGQNVRLATKLTGWEINILGSKKTPLVIPADDSTAAADDSNKKSRKTRKTPSTRKSDNQNVGIPKNENAGSKENQTKSQT